MSHRASLGWFWWVTCLLLGCMQPAHGELTVLVGEPFGSFGEMMPTGHVSLFLDRACADGPIRIRMCRPDESQGVVIARLNAIGPLDWLASPVMDFLYGASDPSRILAFANARDLDDLQQIYRRQHLWQQFPDEVERKKTYNEWSETVGVSYIRRLWGYSLATTSEQDERFIAWLNARPNVHQYRLKDNNCADFIANAVNFYYPGAVRRNGSADLWMMTPKQVGRGVWQYGVAHPEAGLRMIEIPQIPGELPRSKPLRGATDMLLKTKKYLAVEIVVQPEIVLAMWISYLEHGRWQIGSGSEVITPEEMLRMTQPVAVTSDAQQPQSVN